MLQRAADMRLQASGPIGLDMASMGLAQDVTGFTAYVCT